MTRSHLIPVAILVLTPAGCGEQDTYPITGFECGPDDPVKTVDAMGCIPPGTSGVGGL